MRVTGRFDYTATPEVLYHTFTDPAALINATPGLQSLREVETDRWEAVIKVGVGGFALTYQGTMTVEDRKPGEGYRIRIDAATHNGRAQAETLLRFLPLEEGRARVEYEADVAFFGGQKLLPAIARGLVDFFMYGIKEHLERQSAPTSA